MHSSVHTEYSLASVETLAASRRRIWWEKVKYFIGSTSILTKNRQIFPFFQMNSQFSFLRLLFLANPFSFILNCDFLLWGCSVSVLSYALLYPLFLPL